MDYEEETGTRQSDPVLNERIRRHFGLPLVKDSSGSSSLESKLESKVSPNIIKEGLRIMERTETGEYIGVREMTRILGDLESVGLPINVKYQSLGKKTLYALFRATKLKLLKDAERYSIDLSQERIV